MRRKTEIGWWRDRNAQPAGGSVAQREMQAMNAYTWAMIALLVVVLATAIWVAPRLAADSLHGRALALSVRVP
ncbi:MAG: hypothetical protein R3D84_08755 [Paracoccaceae bacterium]